MHKYVEGMGGGCQYIYESYLHTNRNTGMTNSNLYIVARLIIFDVQSYVYAVLECYVVVQNHWFLQDGGHCRSQFDSLNSVDVAPDVPSQIESILTDSMLPVLPLMVDVPESVRTGSMLSVFKLPLMRLSSTSCGKLELNLIMIEPQRVENCNTEAVGHEYYSTNHCQHRGFTELFWRSASTQHCTVEVLHSTEYSSDSSAIN